MGSGMSFQHRLYAQMYDKFHDSRNVNVEIENLLLKIKNHMILTPQSWGLDYGCGTGLHAKEMLRKGYQILLMDKSDSMLEVATQRVGKSYIYDESIHNEVKFDFIYSLFDVVSYQTTHSALEAFVNSARKLIKPGGLFIFDGWYLPGYIKSPPRETVRSFNWESKKYIRKVKPLSIEEDGLSNLEISILEEDSNRLFFTENHLLKAYAQKEIEKVVSQYEFDVIEWRDGNDWTSDIKDESWRFFCVSRRCV